MNLRNLHKIRLKRISLLMTLILIILFPAYLFNLSNFTGLSKYYSEDSTITNDFNEVDGLESSVLGNDTWWDTSFGYRKLLKITNTNDYNFTDYGVSVKFNYLELAGKIQSSLDDIRIVENGIERKYYVVKDYPSSGFATVYFDTNISQNSVEFDTYMYFNKSVGSNEASGVLDSFGWVKNGDFELDNSTDQYFEPYGWTFSHDQVDQIKDVYNPREAANNSETSYAFFENNLVHIDDLTPSAERVESGYYAYKWGGQGSLLPQISCKDYVGTFYSYPFKVPIVEGGYISLNVYRNVRTYMFEDPHTSLPTISEDGYFLRICNGSDSKYTSDVDLHENVGGSYESWIETYGGYAYVSPNQKTLKYEEELKEHLEIDPSLSTRSSTILDGDLTGSIEIDLSNYMGDEIFIEFGTWGPEDGAGEIHKSGFFQVDDIRFNYTISAEIQDLQAQVSDVEIIVKDVDGRIVPTAEVMIVKNSVSVASGTSSNGRVTFNNLPNGYYNITVNYTIGSLEEEVFNSTDSGDGPYYFNGISYTQVVYTDLWTIDFEIVDWDGIPLTYGYIEINESLGGPLIDTLSLDSNGEATFRWLKQPSYYYKVYYDNEDYGTFTPTALNESYILRSQYVQNGVKFQQHNIELNESSIGSYSISERIYTNGSKMELSTKKIIKANITLENMDNYMQEISIYYIDKEDTTTGNLIYNKIYTTTNITDDYIELDIGQIDNENLRNDNYEAYGLLIEVNGFNSTQTNGEITVELTETCNVYNRTALARLNIRVIENFGSAESPEGDPRSATIKVIDDLSGQPLINLSSFNNRDGYAYGPKNSFETPFWFLIGRKYNFSLDVANITDASFNISHVDPAQWTPGAAKITEYNYTLYGNSSITFNLRLEGTGVNTTNFDSSFNASYGTTDVSWGDDLNFWAIFTSTSDNWQTWDYVSEPPATCYLTVKLAGTEVVLMSKKMSFSVLGNFSITFNSGLLSAGTDNEYYDISINGFHPTYDDPIPALFLVKINAIPTILSAHDYDTKLELPTNTYSAPFDELVNISIKYSIEASGFTLEDAILTYSWIGLDPVTISIDPLDNDYYTFTLNTFDAQSTGIKVISITASLENYTAVSFSVYLNILQRQSTLNDETDLVYMSPSIWIQDAKYFTFTYKDANTLDIIGDLTITSYSWYELDEFGERIPGSQGTGTLIQNPNNTYYVDFDTDFRSVGYYFLHISLQKDNYEPRFAYIDLEIKLREFTATWDATGKGTTNRIQVVKGRDIDFQFNLDDLSRDNIDLENATITLNLGEESHVFTEDMPGNYVLTFNTNIVDAFLSPKTLVGTITIEKANFTTQTIPITIVVSMEEIFPGMPTFYFILIVASVVAVVGSIVGYRVIQQARIPKHVKKIRKIKGAIKSKKKIADTISIPSKMEMFAKLFGDDWKALGLSIDDALGIKDKSKKLPSNDKISKEGGAIE
ncbi:MAG: carboxypeptidase-like regulatory domain-containing protein [Candidatus Thorarchaeota archaeon]